MGLDKARVLSVRPKAADGIPTLPELPGWELEARTQPAHDQCGDFYDTFALPGGRIGLIVGDVCDTADATAFMERLRDLIPVALQQSLSKARLNGAQGRARAALREAVATVNQAVFNSFTHEHIFVTLFLGVLDSGTGELFYVNAGHEAPVILVPGRIAERLGPSGPAVGLMDPAYFEVQQAQIEPGETLLVYTDGVTDARNGAGERLLLPRLLELLNGATRTAGGLVNAIEALVSDHAGGEPPFDDITLVAVRRAPATELKC